MSASVDSKTLDTGPKKTFGARPRGSGSSGSNRPSSSTGSAESEPLIGMRRRLRATDSDIARCFVKEHLAGAVVVAKAQ